MRAKKFTVLWFPLRVKPIWVKVGWWKPHVDVRNARQLSGTDQAIDEPLPAWASDTKTRRLLVILNSAVLAGIWALCMSAIHLGWLHYSVMAIASLAILGVLNYSLRSLFDQPDEVLDERLHALRDSYAYRSYQAAGLLVLALLAAMSLLDANPARMWLPAIMTYASIPYLLAGWKERHFA